MSCGNSRSSKCNPCGPSEAAMNAIADRAAYYARIAKYSLDEFTRIYLGAKDTAPTTDNEGQPLQEGALYFNTVSNILFVWNGTSWTAIDDDEIYLGGFSVAPTLNNQGLPLQLGNLYWNTGSNNLWAYNGSTWIRTNFNETTPFLSTGSTTARTLANRFADMVNVLDFIPESEHAAIKAGTSTFDCTSNINQAIGLIATRKSGTVYFPSGKYKITDYIGTAVVDTISIQLLGEAGTIIDCQPTTFTNYGIYIFPSTLVVCIVRDITINCNNKVAAGIVVRSNNASESILIDNCEVNDAKCVTGASSSAFGIFVSSPLGYTCAITNCRIFGVTRDGQADRASQGIVVDDIVSVLIQNNIINSVRHGMASSPVDADGIVVFSYLDGSSRYYRQGATTIINNRIINTEGRGVKLQTSGNTVVENNIFSLTDPTHTLIDNFKFIDSQVASATIAYNKFQSLANWSGGSSFSVATLQYPSEVWETNETFTSRFENNDFYTTKRVAYGVIVYSDNTPQANVNYIVKNNTFSTDEPMTLTGTAVNASVARFIYLSGNATLASFTGRNLLDISENKISCSAGILSVAITDNSDFVGKWFWNISNNFIYTDSGRDVIVTSGGALYNAQPFAYTSSISVKDNHIGSSPSAIGGNRVTLPINLSNILCGCNFETPSTTAVAYTNVPAFWGNGRVYKTGIITGVETISSGAKAYLSQDGGSTWSQI
jgi:parallel beta-helix repeat protein